MNKYCIDKWDKNKDKLKEAIENSDNHKSWDYINLVKLVIENILNNGADEYDRWNTKEIVEIDQGDYQGTKLFIFHRCDYQPSCSDYMITKASYGSCTVCDTLQSIQWGDYDYEDLNKTPTESQVKDYMTLCLHLIQHMRSPYWSNAYWIDRDDLKEI
jgi:hypothetical protein